MSNRLTALMYNVGGTLTYDGLHDTQPSNAYVRLLDGDGTEVLGATEATVSIISTTLTGVVSRGDNAVNVASNTGISSGSTFWLRNPDEELLVLRVEGTSVKLRRPTEDSHENNGAVEGTRISYTVNSTTASKLWWDGHAEWNIDGSVYDHTGVICSKYPMRAVLPSTQDILDVFPLMERGKPDAVDLERLAILGKDRVMNRAAHRAPDRRAETFVGSSDFRHCAALAAVMLYFMPMRGEENREIYERVKADFEDQTDMMLGISSRDADQDGVVSLSEQITPNSIKLII